MGWLGRLRAYLVAYLGGYFGGGLAPYVAIWYITAIICLEDVDSYYSLDKLMSQLANKIEEEYWRTTSTLPSHSGEALYVLR